MTEQELEQAFRSIVKNESKVRIWDSKQVIGRYVWWTGPTLYYNQLGDFKGPEYAHYAWGSKDIYAFFRKVVRIEKEINGEWKPVYTKFDGIISSDEPMAKIGYKYYTEKYLQHILDKFAPTGMA